MQQIKWINQAKGFAMLCVVFGHSIVGSIRNESVFFGICYDYIYLFHMPLFFFLAGYLYQINEAKYLNESVLKFVKSKFQSLMVPYFFYSVFTYCAIFIAEQIPHIGEILRSGGYHVSNFVESFLQIAFWQNSLDQHLWFIYALFVVFILNILFCKCKDSFINTIVLAVFLCLHFCTMKLNIDIVQRIFNYQIYFLLGRICYRTDFMQIIESKKAKKYVYIVAIILSVIKMNIINITFDNYAFTVIKAMFSIIVSFSMVLAVCLAFRSSSQLKVNFLFEKVYKYNFEIYILHQPFIVSGLAMVLLSYTTFSPVIIVLSVTVVGILISIFLAWLLNRNRVIKKILFGRK